MLDRTCTHNVTYVTIPNPHHMEMTLVEYCTARRQQATTIRTAWQCHILTGGGADIHGSAVKYTTGRMFVPIHSCLFGRQTTLETCIYKNKRMY